MEGPEDKVRGMRRAERKGKIEGEEIRGRGKEQGEEKGRVGEERRGGRRGKGLAKREGTAEN